MAARLVKNQNLGEVKKIPLEAVAAARDAVLKAQTDDPDKVALLTARQNLAELELELAERRYNVDVEFSKQEIFDAEITLKELTKAILVERRRVVDAAMKSINTLLADIAKRGSKVIRSSIESIRRDLAELPLQREGERKFLELELKLAKLRSDALQFAGFKSEVNSKLNAEGSLPAIKAEVETLQGLIKNAVENPEEEVFPHQAKELRSYRDGARRRNAIAKDNLAFLRVTEPSVAKKKSVFDYRPQDLEVAIDMAFAESNESRFGVSAARRDRLKTELPTFVTEQKKSIDDFLNSLRGARKGWTEVRDLSDQNARFLSDRLLWTRDESKISLESIQSAFKDLSDAAGDLGGLIKNATSASLEFFTAKKHRLRNGIALAFILIVGFGFWRLHMRLPKTYGWLDAQAHEGKNLPLVLGIVLRRTDVSMMVAVIFVGAPLIAGFDSAKVKLAACVFGVPFLYRLGRVLLDVLMLPGNDAERILNLDEDLARTLHRAGRWLLNLAVFFVPVGLLAELGGYAGKNPGVIELWWLVYESLSHAILLFSVFRPAVVGSIIRGSGVVAVSVKTWILILYPFVVGGILFLFVLGSLRYWEAEQFFQSLLLKTLGILFLGFLAYRLLLRAAIKGRNLSKEPNSDEFEKDRDFVEAGRALFFDRLTRSLIRLVFIVPVFFLIYRFWDEVELGSMEAGLFGEGTVTATDIVKAIFAMMLTTSIVRLIRQALAYVILPRTDLDKGLRYTVSMLVTYALWTFGAVITLNIIKIRGEHIAVFTGALAFGIGFGLQSIVKNFVSGLILLIERPVKVGEKIDVGGKGGAVEKITLRATTVMTWEGTGIVIPNETMIGGTLTNHSLGHPRLRSSLLVGVAYGCDIRRVREIMTETVKSHGLTLKRPAPEAFFMGFGDSSLDFQVRYWTSMSTHRLRVISDLRFAIEEAFRREDIEIPFPQRDLNIRSVDGDVVGAFGGTLGDETTIQHDKPGKKAESKD